jgi:hypothetical protein
MILVAGEVGERQLLGLRRGGAVPLERKGRGSCRCGRRGKPYFDFLLAALRQHAPQAKFEFRDLSL